MGCELDDDAVQRRVGSDHQAEDAEDDYDGVLDDHANPLGARDEVPVGAALDERREG